MTPAEIAAANTLIELAFAEDLGDPADDLTSRLTIPEDAVGQVQLVAREGGVIAGLPILSLVFERLDSRVAVETRLADGAPLEAGTVVARISGPLRSLLTGERTALNFLTHLSGVASLTHCFVESVHGTAATILDTRKTIPGYRVLEKYAVRAGGGTNHRGGLYDGCLIKDNHIAAWRVGHPGGTLAALIGEVRAQVGALPLEIEVDNLEQLADALAGEPDIILLDNMAPPSLRRAVAMRDERQSPSQLEASGGVTLETVAAIAATGVDRISVGALTHSARTLDLAFDWADGRR